MEEVYIIHTSAASLRITREEAIAEAERQAALGVKPMYRFDLGRGDRTPPGWLIWSTWEDGAGVAYLRSDGVWIIARGWQGEFVYG